MKFKGPGQKYPFDNGGGDEVRLMPGTAMYSVMLLNSNQHAHTWWAKFYPKTIVHVTANAVVIVIT